MGLVASTGSHIAETFSDFEVIRFQAFVSGYRSVRMNCTGLCPDSASRVLSSFSIKGVGPPAPAQASTKVNFEALDKPPRARRRISQA